MISVGIFFAYINPTWSGPIAATKLAIKNDDDALSAAAQYKTTEGQLAAAEASIDPASLARLTTLLPDSVNNVGIILDVNTFAARSGLVLSNIDVLPNADGSAASASGDPTDTSGSTGSVDLSLTALGTYSALQTFLTGIEKSARLLDVQDISVTGSDTGVYNYQMTIRLYWLR
jgi:Tfp pilus assembly protein PilO